jgi:hypothetical protein
VTRAAPRRDPGFERAFVAMRYFLGARSELASPLGAVSEESEALARELEGDDRRRRAEVLAAELGHVVRALEARSYR